MSGENKADKALNKAASNTTEPKVSKSIGSAVNKVEEKADATVDAMKKKEKELKAKAQKFAEEHDGEEIKRMAKKGFTDFKNVFLYPLLTGVMTGVGFIAGKKLAEAYFYPQPTVVITAPKVA